MATDGLNLGVGSATPPDNSTNNLAAQVLSQKGTGAAPVPFNPVGYFDAGTSEHLWWTFHCPPNYASGGTFRIEWGANATTGNVVWAARINALTAGDPDTYLEHNAAAATTATTSVNTTEARRPVQTTITPATDSMAAGDLVRVVVYREGGNGSDTCSVDAEMQNVIFEYTTA